MQGWIIPPPKEPAKSKEEIKKEREEKVRWLIKQNLVLLENSEKRIIKKIICEVLYIPLRGRFGVSEE
jgi:hypothetical protein